jgi:hypothetical protein
MTRAVQPHSVSAMTRVEVGGEGWSAQLPAGWRAVDLARPGCLESPDATAGAYFLHVVVRDNDLIASMRSTQANEVAMLPDDGAGWHTRVVSDPVDGSDPQLLTRYYNATARYLICSCMKGRGRRFVRMTFHDYDCGDPERSVHEPHRWLASLSLDDPRAIGQ